MATPGTEVVSLDKPAIAFGSYESAGAPERFGGFPYQLDYNLALLDPSRVTISFISEDGTYNESALSAEIWAAEGGTKNPPTLITYCGGSRIFYGYPLKYSISKAPRGNILTVDYYDASIAELDNRLVLLNGQDIPLIDDELAQEGVEDSSLISFKYIADNPCPYHILNLGKEYIKSSTGIPQAGNTKCSAPDEVSQILYTNNELRKKLEDIGVPLDPSSIEILCPSEPTPQDLFYEGFHGTLREVLREWGDRIGFTFYWDSGSPANGGGSATRGQLTFIDLKDGVMYTELEQTAEKMLGACNLLESTKSVSMVNTFNKAVAANYVNEGIGLSQQQDQFMILDLLTLPVRGCVTDYGRPWPKGDYEGGWNTNDPRYGWRDSDEEWYKEWANPNYIGTKEDGLVRKWQEYGPIRPQGEPDTETEDYIIYRDYMRLVKAAALGESFFRAYVYWKAMKCENTITEVIPPMSLEEWMGANAPDIGGWTPQEAAAAIYRSGLQLTDNSDGSGGFPQPPIIDEAAAYFVATTHAGNASEGFLTAEGGVLVPNLVENKALTILLSATPESGAAAVPPVNTPNVKICRKTVLGKNCLTVRPLDTSYQAVQNLYNEAGNKGASTVCNPNHQLLNVAEMKEAGSVYRTFFQSSAGGATPVDEKNGSPYIFTYTHQHGNSMALGGDVHQTLYKQLSYIAENAGRFWVSSEILTLREFNQRNYNQDGIKFINRFLDVNDSPLRGLFQEFDPLASEAQQPWSDSEYEDFMGTEFTKSEDSSQKQLNGFADLEPPATPPSIPCGHKNGQQFNPANTKTAENTKAPSVQQMILKVLEKTYPQATDCDFQSEASDLEPASFPSVDLVSLDSGDYILKEIYYGGKSGQDFIGGKGYSETDNDGNGPEITIEGGAGLSITPIVGPGGVIMEIVIENPSSVTFSPVDGEAPVIDITISPPEGGTVGFFNEYAAGTSMENMDSITSSNLSVRNKQKALACCCTDLEEGLVIWDKGSQLTLPYGDILNKSVERLSAATNLPIASNRQANIVRDYAADGKVVTFSTNLIPRDALSGGSADSLDELDWIVDQVRIGADGADPTFKGESYIMPTTHGSANLSGAGCLMASESLPYLVRNNKFEMMAVCIPQLGSDDSGIVIKSTLPGSYAGVPDMVGCEGFTSIPEGINAREMQIEFITPNNEDLKLEFGCGEAWQDLDEEQKEAKLNEIRTKLIDFVKERAYMHKMPSYEASVTIADNFLLDSSGSPVEFSASSSTESGIPSVKQGLESLSVKVDGAGLRITVNLGTRKKLQALKKNFNQWTNPRLANELNGGADQE